MEAVYKPGMVEGRKLPLTPAAEALGSNGSLYSDQQTASVATAWREQERDESVGVYLMRWRHVLPLPE